MTPSDDPLLDPLFDPAAPRPLVQRLGVVLWPSFLVAGAMSVLFFAVVDPLALRDISFPGRQLSREFGYTLGFFMFWLATLASSGLTGFLSRPAPRAGGDDAEEPLP
ncbi:hypothetical protein QSH18_20435 [Xanthomonas sp. NCPPB 2654]|uniref:hypothetical protein n=1 Tax=unclassified Xanthomonas TaxID=2643310 RepID=UPI0021DFA9D5|nr:MULTISPECIES: hypothetical protein [unclassified Xanthomonas]MDL5367979.1 hypothetical protein [Xanthomonas sp. NCPPB 2654]MEB1528591.1 hypothetical protein [Xanthomonas campestris pv. campestris]UYC22434.1 hypothetical protein NUG20_09195 [Xanthomonas sp. CFBP 8443]